MLFQASQEATCLVSHCVRDATWTKACIGIKITAPDGDMTIGRPIANVINFVAWKSTLLELRE